MSYLEETPDFSGSEIMPCADVSLFKQDVDKEAVATTQINEPDWLLQSFLFPDE